jgi:hypothetical protein
VCGNAKLFKMYIKDLISALERYINWDEKINSMEKPK